MMRATVRIAGTTAGFLLAAGAALAQEHLKKPLVLRGIGSFYVGGGLDSIEFSGFGGARPGRVWANAMYVQYMIPQNVRHPYPLVLWSGGCHTGVEFETTPDGREGWLLHFVRAGYRVYVVDATWRGRSPFVSSTTMGVRQGTLPLTDIPSTLTCDSAIAAPPTGGFRLYGSNFPIEALHEYMAQLVPDYFFSPQNGPPPNVAALEALLRRIGPSVVLAHSQGGLSVYPTVIQSPHLFKGYVAVEALGSCGAITSSYPDVPTLIMSGDPIFPDVPPPFGITGCQSIAPQHPNLTVVWLPEAGIRGNSHMMPMDSNNDQIADFISDWIVNIVEPSKH